MPQSFVDYSAHQQSNQRMLFPPTPGCHLQALCLDSVPPAKFLDIAQLPASEVMSKAHLSLEDPCCNNSLPGTPPLAQPTPAPMCTSPESALESLLLAARTSGSKRKSACMTEPCKRICSSDSLAHSHSSSALSQDCWESDSDESELMCGEELLEDVEEDSCFEDLNNVGCLDLEFDDSDPALYSPLDSVPFRKVPEDTLIAGQAAMYGFSQYATALGTSYFTRMCAQDSLLQATALASPDFCQFAAPGPQQVSCKAQCYDPHSESWLLALHLTSIYIACKMTEALPYKHLLPTILSQIRGERVTIKQAMQLELEVCGQLEWRLSPHMEL